jgi:hypothetical protein
MLLMFFNPEEDIDVKTVVQKLAYNLLGLQTDE